MIRQKTKNKVRGASADKVEERNSIKSFFLFSVTILNYYLPLDPGIGHNFLSAFTQSE